MGDDCNAFGFSDIILSYVYIFMITFIQKRFIFLSLNRIIHSVDTVFKQLVKARDFGTHGGGGQLEFDFGTHAWTRKRVKRGVFLDRRVYARTREKGGKISLKQENDTFSKFRGKIVKRDIFRGLWHRI